MTLLSRQPGADIGAWLLLPLVLILGCGGKNLLDREWTSAHFHYFSRSTDDSVCSDLLPVLEAHEQTITSTLGIDEPTVTYYKFDSIDDFNANSDCNDAVACAPGTTAESPGSFDRHELIHAYLAPLGLPPWLLVEGAAVALSCQRYPRPDVAWRDAFSADRHTAELYGAGGWLVGYLLMSFDPGLFVQLYSTVTHGASADAFAQAVQSVYGVSVDDVWSSATSGANAPMFCPWDCSRPAFPFGSGSAMVVAPACGAGDEQLTFNLAQDTLAEWTVDQASFSVRSCDGLTEPQISFSGTSGPSGVLTELPTGDYFVDITVETGSSPTLAGASIPGTLSSPICATAPAVPPELLALSTTSLFYPPDSSERFTSLGPSPPVRGGILLLSDSSASVQLCPSCDATAGCTSIASGGIATVQNIAPGATLDIPAGGAATLTLTWF